jgi:signal transduction histidine kinase
MYAVTSGSRAGSASPGPALSQPFYLLTMIAAIIFACLGGYLLWRDVRRDLDLAEIRSQFAASVSHELKTPLTSIRMFAETVRLGRLKDEAARGEYLDTIINESERLSRLLNNVLDISKIEQGRMMYHPRPQALAPILRTAARTMDYPLRQQGFSLEVEIDEDLTDVRVDADALEQALLNLIGNAIKYSGTAREIGLKLVREGSWAVIRVIDHGVGIPPGDRQRIFEKFYRVPSPENSHVPGTGLGLALVAHFAQDHGGRIEVDGAPVRGSTFSLFLPLEVEP